jgi:hypothetical protein
MTARNRLARTGLVALLALGIALAAAEVLLRRSGHQPFRAFGVQSREPPLFEVDRERGWRPKPGAYIVPGYAAGEPNIPFTLLADGSRATSGDNADGRDAVAFVGCWLTQGWAVPDDQTFAWRIQEHLPSIHVRNYGCGAYSTYQALQTMEHVLAGPQPPRMVVYGLMEEHEGRNVAAPDWLLILELFARVGMESAPYCTLDEQGRLVRHAPLRHPHFPLRTSSALSAYLELQYAKATGAARAAQARPVTERLLLEMNRLAKSRGVRFAVVLLHGAATSRLHYLAFLQRNHVDVLDCGFRIRPQLQVPGEGHPNGIANARWARCLEGFIADAMDAPLQHDVSTSGPTVAVARSVRRASIREPHAEHDTGE